MTSRITASEFLIDGVLSSVVLFVVLLLYHSMFGPFLKALRERQGLGLREFCSKHQFDASNWSKVEREFLPAPQDPGILDNWAKCLGVAPDSEEWKTFFDLAARDRRGKRVVERLVQAGRGGTLVSPPTSTRPEKLPLGVPTFSWTQFEAFCRDFVEKLDGMDKCTHYGTQGSSQKGIDLFAKSKDGQQWAFQCKQVRKFTAGDLKKAVSKTTYRAGKYVLLVSCEVGSEVREALVRRKKWDLWDVRDISQKVRGLDRAKSAALVERHFGPDWRKLFLGLSPLSPFLSPDNYFERLLQPNRLFNHSWNLVGRADVLTELINFAHSEVRVAILPGRGGSGKSKLLQVFSTGDASAARDLAIWFLQEGVSLTPEMFEELPVGRVLLVVDDAHRRDDVGLLLAYANRRPDLKLLFSARPQGVEILQNLLSRSGFDRTEIRLLPELKQLDRLNVVNLATQALGPGYTHLAEPLARVTRDSPLVTVVGGRLLAKRAIHPALLERDEEFRYAVLNRFSDEMLGQIGQENPALYRLMLQLISATAPVYPDQKYVELAVAYLEKTLEPKDRQNATTEGATQAIGQLEHVGLLLRRGRSLRITPDVLADHILATLCVAPNGVPTGAAEKLFDHFVEHSPERVLKNLAEVDWRIERTSGEGIDLLGKIWNKLEQDFLSGHSHSRLQLLKIVQQAAYFQPAHALGYVRMAHRILREPAPPQNPDELFALSNANLLTELPEILQHAAYNMDYLQECCDILWQLGRSDARPLNQFPEHGIRILQSLASYHPNKPLAFNEIVLDCLDSWLRDPGAFDFAHSPLSVLDEFFEKSAEESKSEGGALVVTTSLINPKTTKPIRSRALEILARTVKGAKPPVAVSILETLRSVLFDRFKMGATPESPDYYDYWIPEKIEALRCIEQIVADSQNPLIHWKVLQILEWPSAESPQPVVRTKAQAVVQGVPDSFGLRLTRALANDTLLGHRVRARGTDQEFRREIEEKEKRDREFRAAVAVECVTKLKGAELFATIDRYVREMEQAGFSNWPNHLLWEFGANHHDEAMVLADCILSSPDSLLVRFFHILVGAIGSWSKECMSGLIQKAQASRAPNILRSLAQHYWFFNRDQTPVGSDLEVLISLLRSEDAHTSRIAIESLGFLAQKNAELAFELAIQVPIQGQQLRAEAVCQVFEKAFGINPDRLSDHQLVQLLRQLDEVPDLEDHWIQQFLSFAAKRTPLATVELFVRRIEHRASERDTDFRPIPYHVAVDFESLAKHSEYPTTLRRIRDLTMGPSWHYRYFARDLFWMVTHGGAGLDVLREWVNSGDKAKIVAAGCILEKSGKNFVFGNPEFVALMLERAAAIDEDCYGHVFVQLHSSATSGSKSGIAGQPMPRDVEVREKASLLINRFAGQPKVKAFYESLAKVAETNIRDDRARYEEMFDDQ